MPNTLQVTKKQPRWLFPLVLADVVLFTLEGGLLKVLLIRRSNAPTGWALPGGLLNPEIDRSIDDTAIRVLATKTRVRLSHLEQIAVHSGPDRDPRGWSISVVYLALLPSDKLHAVVGDKAEAIAWCDPENLGHRLVFDHKIMLREAAATLRNRVLGGALPLHLLPARFTLTELQHTCEEISKQKLDKSAFRRQLKDSRSLTEVRGAYKRGAQRPAQLYRATAGFKFKLYDD